MSFDTLGLRPGLIRAIADAGYAEPTPVQAAAIPLVLEGRDLMARAQTGTGKTAAFALPLLQRLVAGRSHDDRAAPGPGSGRRTEGRPPRALVLTPTRELAIQVDRSIRTYGRYLPIRTALVYGGVGLAPQVRALRQAPDVVVATPGRLLDHVGQRTVDLSRVEILVLDEADRMLDMGFIRDIRRILGLLPEVRQNLLFSATLSAEIRSLAAFLDHPAVVDVTPMSTTAELVEQRVIGVDAHRKQALLTQLVRTGGIDQALVFTRTKHRANRVSDQLVRSGIRAAAIHGNKSQGQRIRALDDFKAGRVEVLVATDVAARGIDIASMPCVVNYELPSVPGDYVHRIGRTGRAGVSGHAVSLVSIEELGMLRDIEHLLKRTLGREVVPGFEPDHAARVVPVPNRRPVSRSPGMPARAPHRPAPRIHPRLPGERLGRVPQA